jgi:phage-related protein
VAVKAFFYMVAGLITALLIPTLLELFATILANPITWIIMLLAGLALVIEDLVVWADGGESALGDLWTAIFGSPEEAKQNFEDLKQTLIDIYDTVMPLIKSFQEWWQTLEMGDKIFASISPFGMLFELGQLAIDTFIDYAIGKFGEFGDWINEQFSAIGEWIDGVFQSISDTASSVVSAIEGFFAGLRDSIMSLIGEAIDWAIGKLAELAAAVKSTPIIGGAIDYVTGGGGTTNNTVSSKYNVIVNTNATDAEGTGRAVGNAMMGYNARMANGGVK